MTSVPEELKRHSLRSRWRIALSALVRPSTVGAAWMGALSIFCFVRTLADDQVQGVSVPSVRKLIRTRFAGEIFRSAGVALATSLAVGLLLGAAAGWIVRTRDRLSDRPQRSSMRLALAALGVAVWAHATLWMHDLATFPQAYAPALYARGAMRATFQVAVCDGLGSRGVVAISAILLIVWLAPALRHAAQARHWRTIAAALTVPTAIGALLLLAPIADRATIRRVKPNLARRPNVLIIAADSLRADRLESRVAPELSALASRGGRFDRAYVSLPRTFPSWVSILSGRDPHHHGIRHMFPRSDPRSRDVGAIPKSFGAAGYHTAVVSDFAGDIFRRMDLGFSHARTPTFNIRELVKEIVVGGQGSLLPWLRSRASCRILPVLRELHDTTQPSIVTADALDEIDQAGERPFFVVAFYSTTHFPYAAPAPGGSRFVDKAYRGPFRYGKTPSVFPEHRPTEADVRAIRAQYDGAVAAVDRSVSDLLTGLRLRGLDDNTILVVTADHGESLFEADRGQGHGDHLFGDEVTHVPLVIVDPRKSAATRIPDLVRSVDLAPTLCELATVSCASNMDGRTLVPLLEGKSLPARPVFAETGIWFTRQIPDVPPSLRLPYPDITEVLEVDLDHDGELVARNSFEPWLVAAKHRMVRDERYKLVYAPTREGTKWMLFDTRQDPLEVSNVAGLHPEIAARLQGLLWSWMLEDQLSARRGEAVEPQPAPAPTSTATALASTRFAGVAIRLSELLATASVDTPNLASVDASLDHWRRMPSPWIRKAARSDRAVQQIALVRGDGTQKLAPISADRTWAPDPHLWNMNVGSFDQRESILAPPPSTLRFTGLTLPRGATLQTAPAVVGANPTGVEFEVAVKSGNGPRSIVALRRIEAGIPEAFQDWRVDLSPWNGKVIDLELVTRSAPAPTVPAAIWGSPVIVAADSSDVPFNVLYIVVDALRGDAIASTHDDATDARMQSAKFGPLDAWLPRLAEVAPNLDALARRGVIFSQAYSSATWTRPSTVAMMAGIPSRALGMSATPLVPQAAELQNLYAQRPPFLPLLLRPHGVWTRAIVNNYYMVGYAGVGVDMGFDALIDHRHNTRDTAEIVNDAKLELDRSKDHRFFLFVNFVSPHSPYEPPASAIEAIPKPPRGPQHEIIRMYLAEVHKDDAAIGELIERLGQLGLSDNTLIVVTADHGETLSRAHTAIPFGLAGEPDTSGRFQHLLTLYDETARVPLLLVLPGKLPAGTRVQDPVSNTDVVATLLALAGIAPPANVRGESLLPLVHGQRLPERPILVEGRGAHAIRVGRWRLIVREPGHTRVRIKGAFVEQPLELYDLETDPGERVEVSQLHPDVVERLLAVDKAQQSTTPLLRTPAATAGPSLRLRFAGAGARHKVRGRISTSNQQGASITSASEVSIGPNALRRMRDAVELDFETVPDRVVGVDLIVEPPNANITWHFALDDKPWPEERVYAGSLGMVARELATGLLDDNSRGTARASTLPWIDPEYDLGMFVIGNASEEVLELGSSDAAKQEAMGLMRSWGYVR